MRRGSRSLRCASALSWVSSTLPSSRSRCPRCSGRVRRIGRRGDLGRPLLSAGSGGDCHGGWTLCRHAGQKAPLRLRLRHLHPRLRSVRPGAGPGSALRLPGPSGCGRCDVAGSNSLAIIVLVVEEKALGKAIGLQGAAQALGLALGPTVGGLLLRREAGGSSSSSTFRSGSSEQSQRSCSCPGAATFWLELPSTGRDSPSSSRPSWSSCPLSRSVQNLDGARPPSLVLFCVAAVLFVVFVRHERHDKEPMLDLGLFRSGQFSTGIVSGLLYW